MRRCLKTCKELDVACPVTECRYWIDVEEESNCTFESVRVNGPMTLREAADRLGVSFVRVKQIQDKALKKIGHFFKDESI